MDYESETKLITLLTQLMSPKDLLPRTLLTPSFIEEVNSLLQSIDWDSQPKPESEFMSLTTQIISLFSTMNLDSQPKPISEVISFFSRETQMDHEPLMPCLPHPPRQLPYMGMPPPPLLSLPSPSSLQRPTSPPFWQSMQLDSLLHEILDLEPEPKLISLIYQILSLVFSMNPVREKLVSLSRVMLEEGNFHVHEKSLYQCFPFNWRKLNFTGEEDVTYFHCLYCNGENHKEYNKTPAEIKHALHRKHFLKLVLYESSMRKCYCCDEDLKEMVYYCSTCDLAINFACAEKQQVLSIDHPKWHEHTLTLFPRTSLTCDMCSLTHSSCPFYTCPPCNFVVHQSCISLPRVIRISRHLHRIAFTHSFGVGDWSCGVCRTKIDNDYGGYCCIKKGCSYGVHSKCATQSNVWDGEELEGKSEEIEEEIEPFVRISDGIIHHFLHQHHHLRLDENTCRDYDENRQCHACVTSIYFGNFYSCMQCDFILHEECANLSRNIHHPIHPHMLTLLGGYDGILDYSNDRCSACWEVCKTGFFYKCSKEECRFQLQV